MRIGGLQKFSLSDFPGIPAAIIFTQGCNFRCPFCHNGSLLPMRGENELDVETVLNWLKSRAGKLEGVVVTGGEPCFQADLPEFLLQIKDLGFKVKLDSNGSFPEMLEKVLDRGLVDFVAMDIKASWENYDILCGTVVEKETITKSIESIVQSGVPHLFRTTFVPALMEEQETEDIAKMLPQNSSYKIQEFRSETALDPRLR